jgi:hypothetical protein
LRLRPWRLCLTPFHLRLRPIRMFRRCRGRCLPFPPFRLRRGGLWVWELLQEKIMLPRLNGPCPRAQSSVATVAMVSTRNVSAGTVNWDSSSRIRSCSPSTYLPKSDFTFWMWYVREIVCLLFGHICLWFRRFVDTRNLMERTTLAGRTLPVTPTLP